MEIVKILLFVLVHKATLIITKLSLVNNAFINVEPVFQMNLIAYHAQII